MMPAQRGAVDVLAPAPALADLLTENPGNPGVAATAVAAAASAVVGADVAVLVATDAGWSLLAGREPVVEPGERDGVVRAGPVALVWRPREPLSAEAGRTLRQAVVWLGLAVERAAAADGAAQATAETAVISDVVARLLSVR